MTISSALVWLFTGILCLSGIHILQLVSVLRKLDELKGRRDMKEELLTKLGELSGQIQELKAKICHGEATPGDLADIEHKIWDLKTTVTNYDFVNPTIIVKKKKKKFFGPKA